MTLANIGTLGLNMMIFLTTLVNFSWALTTLEPMTLICLYALSKILAIAPEHAMVKRSNHSDIYYGV